MKLQKDLKEFVAALNARSVKYVLVGGYAVAFHGYPRGTRDIDFLVETSQDNLERLARSIEDFGFGSVGFKPEDLREPDTFFQMGREPHRIDLINEIPGVIFEDAWQSRILTYADDVPLNVIDKKHLITNKIATGRHKDLADVEVLTHKP